MSDSKNNHLEAIEEYYRECENAYRDAWGMDKNKQLNLGLWENGANTLSKALKELNRTMAAMCEINEDSHILDAGCGVGGTAIYMASNFGARVTGITLSPEQLAIAKKNAEKAKLSHLLHFELGDYSNTNFEDHTFDVVIGMESICYAEPKLDFLKEAFRLLKKGGRIVLAENLQGKDQLTKKEYDILYTFGFNGCKVVSLDTEKQYRSNLSKLGFQQYVHIDKSKAVRPSIVRLRRFFYAAWLYNKYHQLIGKKFSDTQLANTTMCYYLLSGLDKGLWKYGLIKAVK